MSDSQRAKSISVLTILGAVVGFLIAINSMINQNRYSPVPVYAYFTFAIMMMLVGIVIGLCLASLPMVVVWWWRKVKKVTDLLPAYGANVIVAALVVYLTCPIWGIACVIVSIVRFINIKKGYSTELWGK